MSNALIEQGFTIPVLDHGFVRYIDHMGSDERIVEAARISYKSPSKGEEQDKRLLSYLYKNRHTSPFEMCKVTFNIKMPIFVMRQYVRHRMQNLNEVSARYTELPNEFYIPTAWRPQDKKNKQGSVLAGDWNPMVDPKLWGESPDPDEGRATQEVTRICDEIYDLYEKLIDVGVAREMARIILPLNIYTEVYVTWDLKNLLHFVDLRDDSHAQYEIQVYGKAIKQILQVLFPWTMEAYEKYKFKVVEPPVAKKVRQPKSWTYV